MAADVDCRSIAAFASVPETAINALLDSPTVDLVRSFLKSLESKVAEFQQIKTQYTRLEVEFETVTRTNESKVKVLQNSRDKALADVSKLREEVQAAEGARAQAQSDLDRLQQTAESDAADAASLKSKITSLESSHRDTLSLLDSKSKDIDRLAQDLSAEHDKVVALRRQVSELEQAKQEATSAATSAKFKKASLEQELELQRKNNEWYETERRQKNEEHQKFRREKNARIAELQQSLEQRIEEADSLKRSENSLRGQLEDQLQRFESLQSQLQKVSDEKLVEADHARHQYDNLNRLYELQKAAADTNKSRVDELSATLEEARDDAAEEIGRIRAEVQEEHNEREAAERRIAELEDKIYQLEHTVRQESAAPETPRQALNGQALSTPLRPSTPSRLMTPGSAHRLKNGVSVTQIYSEYTKLEGQYLRAQAEISELQKTLDGMVTNLEDKQPEIEELAAENKRLEVEIRDIADSADHARAEAIAAVRDKKASEAKLKQKDRELDVSRQTERDLLSQLRRLLLEQRAGSMSDEEYARLLQDLEQDEMRDMQHLSESQQEVNRYLLAFKNIAELQEQNHRQLIDIRQKTTELEEARGPEKQLKIETLESDLAEANAKIAQYQDAIRSMETQAHAYVKERDMFQSMLTRRNQIGPTDFSRSMPIPAGDFSASFGPDRSSVAPDNNVIAMALRELQSQFDAHKAEASANSNSLNTQLNNLTQRNSQLQMEASKNLGEATAATQRYDMLQVNYTALKNDVAELQKRYTSATENATRLEIRAQQAAEELVEARGQIDGLRRESANLKAEKDLWKSTETRLLDDNESLRNERARLDQLNANLQTLLNEKEHADIETRRRLQNQVDNLESEAQTARRKLDSEIEDKNQTSLRHKYENEQNQKKIDDLVAALSAAREELASVKTTRDHLQARLDEVTIELRSAEERLEVFTRPAAAAAEQADSSDTNLTREQELAVEVSELKRDLDLKASELAKAEEHVEEYKGIAQAAEDSLQQLMDTIEADKSDLQSLLEEKERKVADLTGRLEDIDNELRTSNNELSKLRDEQATANRCLDQERSQLQAEMDRLRATEETASQQARVYLEASKEQQKIAENIQQNYDNEVVKHSEAVQSAKAAREEANTARLELVEAKKKLENALEELQQKDSTWADKEDHYKAELEGLKSSKADVDKHNKSLHDSLETLNAQLVSLQQARAPVGVQDESANQQDQSQELSSLNEVIRYLRQEKEIVEVRLHMVTLELERHKRQLVSSQEQLDAARVKLDQQQRASINNDMTIMSNNKLTETITELNLYRESSATLRAEKNQAQQALGEKSQRVEQLEQEIIPLQARIAEVEHHLELKQGEMELLQKDRDGWQQRTQNILSKYDRVDPAELEELKTQLSTLQQERDEAVQNRETLQARIDAIPEEVEQARTELRTRLSEQFKGRDRKMREEKAQLQSELDAVRSELESVTALAEERAAALAASDAANQPDAVDSMTQAQVEELQARVQELEATITEKDAQIAAGQTNQNSIKEKEEQLKQILNKRLAEVKREAEAAKQNALEDLRTSLVDEYEQKLEELKSQKITSETPLDAASTPPPAEESEGSNGRKTFEEWGNSLDEALVKRLLQENMPLKSLVSKSIRKQVDKETESLKAQLGDQQPNSSSEDIDAQVKLIEERFAIEKEEIIQQKDNELETERSALRQELEEAFATEKQHLLDEQAKKLQEEVNKAKASTEKMTSAKTAMLQKSIATNTAKINIVRQAADETPERPVKEVWDIAKAAKPATAETKPVAGSKALANPSEGSQPTVLKSPAGTTAPVPAPTNTATGTGQGSVKSSEETKDDASGTNGKLSPAPEVSNSTVPVPPQTQASETNIQQNTTTVAQPKSTGIPQPASQLPRAGSFAANRARGNTRGGATGIPRPGSSIGNHAGPTNVRGRGGARGGGQNPGSPSRGGLNPSAQQFTPQGKRPREEGEDSGNQGKRIRGGGAGSQ